MNSFQAIFISFLLLAVFSVSLISFGLQLAIDNPSNVSISNDSYVGAYNNNINNVLANFSSDANASQNSFARNIPVISSLVIPFEAVASIWKTLFKVPFSILALVFNTIKDEIFGGANSEYSFVFTILGSIIGVLGFLYAYYWIKTGVPK